MKAIHSRVLVALLLATALAGCSSGPEKPAEISGAREAGGIDKPFRATGNEPFWHVIIEPGQLVLERPSLPIEELRYQTVDKSGTGRRFRASREGLVIEVVTAPQLCRDSMSGMPHPYQVRLVLNGDVSPGCGGDPRQLLTGTEWVVEDLAGRELEEKSRATLEFMPDGRIHGSASCNRYTGSWSLTGATIEMGKLASTRKACPSTLMDQEDRFLRLLESARTFDISPQGALVITSASGKQIRAFPTSR